MNEKEEAGKDPRIDQILRFWFPPDVPMATLPQRWFVRSNSMDSECRASFGELVTLARTTSTLDDGGPGGGWTSEPQGTLALLLLLDQFPRNIYRGSSLSYAADTKARQVAAVAIARGFDRRVSLIQQPFFYLPFMHDESLVGQIASRSLYAELEHRCNTSPSNPTLPSSTAPETAGDADAIEGAKAFAEKGTQMARSHMDTILRFGRFPARNEAMGRESTEEEKAFLKENPVGF